MEKSQENKKKQKDESNLRWFVQVFIMTFILSIVMSFISTKGVQNLGLIPAILLLALVIFIGIIFDILGVAVTVANENEFHAKATKKVKGSKTSIKLIKNSSKVANICADVIGDICGVLSGAISALVAGKILEKTGINTNIEFIISAMVASLTVGGKAIGKEIAKNNATKIVHTFGRFLNKFGQ